MSNGPTGTFGADELQSLIDHGHIHAESGIAQDQVQPSSVDLSLASEVYRMPGSLLPLAGERVRDLIDALAVDRLSASAPLCLVRDAVYLVRLREQLRLDDDLAGYCNSKSSTGRIDLATRVICDGSARYDRIPSGYHGECWVELIPRSFDVVIQSGDSVNQLIVFRDRHVLGHSDVVARHAASPLLYSAAGEAVPAQECVIDGRIVMRADLAPTQVGWVAKHAHRPVVLRRISGHKAEDYFAPIERPHSGYLFLEKDHFYILATSERVVVPQDLACEMVPYDAGAGEFRAHYAGFFDPGWGVADKGTQAVLEVRPHEDDLILRHGQPICAMAYESLTSPCEQPYGSRGNNYAGQVGPRLSKHFST